MSSFDIPEQETTIVSNHDRAQFAELMLESVFAVCSDAILVTDTIGVISRSNPKATELFGYTLTELIGMRIELLLPERFRDRHPSHREDYDSDPRVRQLGNGMQL